MAAHGHAEPEVEVVTPLTDPLGFLSRVASVGLIVGMVLLPHSYTVDPDGASLDGLLKYSNFIWAGYITVQVLESAQRDFTAAWSWVFDNLLAVVGLIVGFMVLGESHYVLVFQALSGDQRHLLFEGLVWDTVDLITGLFIPFIIAGSIKNRNEREGH